MTGKTTTIPNTKAREVYKCARCRIRLDTPSVDHLCTDCREVVPKRRGLTDLTSIHRRVIKPKPFVDSDGNVLTDELPMRPLWDTPEPNELWAQSGMDRPSKHRNRIPIDDK